MFEPIEVLDFKSAKPRILMIGEEDTLLFDINHEADWEHIRNIHSTLELINMVSTESFYENCQQDEFEGVSVNLVLEVVSNSSYESFFVPVVCKPVDGSIAESDVLDELVDIALLLTDNDLRKKYFGRVWDYHKK